MDARLSYGVGFQYWFGVGRKDMTRVHACWKNVRDIPLEDAELRCIDLSHHWIAMVHELIFFHLAQERRTTPQKFWTACWSWCCQQLWWDSPVWLMPMEKYSTIVSFHWYCWFLQLALGNEGQCHPKTCLLFYHFNFWHCNWLSHKILTAVVVCQQWMMLIMTSLHCLHSLWKLPKKKFSLPSNSGCSITKHIAWAKTQRIRVHNAKSLIHIHCRARGMWNPPPMQ